MKPSVVTKWCLAVAPNVHVLYGNCIAKWTVLFGLYLIIFLPRYSIPRAENIIIIYYFVFHSPGKVPGVSEIQEIQKSIIATWPKPCIAGEAVSWSCGPVEMNEWSQTCASSFNFTKITYLLIMMSEIIKTGTQTMLHMASSNCTDSKDFCDVHILCLEKVWNTKLNCDLWLSKISQNVTEFTA